MHFLLDAWIDTADRRVFLSHPPVRRWSAVDQVVQSHFRGPAACLSCFSDALKAQLHPESWPSHVDAEQLLFGFAVNSEQSDREMLAILSSGLTHMNFLAKPCISNDRVKC